MLAARRLVGWSGRFHQYTLARSWRRGGSSQIVGPRVETIAHRCSGEGEAFVIPADGVSVKKSYTGVYKNYIPRVFVK